MDEYTRLKNELDSYLEMEDIELTEEVISAYTLYQLLDEKLKELRNIQFDSNFKDEINKGLRIVKKVGRIFKRESTSIDKKCNCVMSSCNGTKSEITFGFDDHESSWGSYYLTVCKDVNSDQIYFDRCKADKGFVEKYYDRISEHFQILEEFSLLYQGGVGNSGKDDKQIFSDGFLNITLSYDTYGRTKIATKIEKAEDPEDIYEREWLKRQTLSEYVKENQEAILRKVPVKISELNHTTKTVVEECLSKMNNSQLVKKK